MAYPVFDFKYQKAYSSAIRFDTQINSKELGREQRYPKKIYPVRSFVLHFNKNFTERQALEDFFVEVCGSYGFFNWTWAVEKGGNGNTYLCWFDIDDFTQKVDRLGYTDCELKIFTIDRNAYEAPADFSFYHKAKTEYKLSFYTLIDKVVTAQNSRRKIWNSPKRSWTLVFEKNKAEKDMIEAFFIAKRGKFKAFQWKWEKSRGGDDVTYWVRFDTDELTFQQYNGYMSCEIKLQEVFAPVINDEYDKDEIVPRKLIKIAVPNSSINIIDNDTLESIVFKGDNYLGAPLDISSITQSDNTEVSSLKVTISNIDQGVSGIVGQNGDIITNCEASLYQVFLNTSDFSLVTDSEKMLFIGKVNNLHLTNETATIDIQCSLGGFEKSAPFMHYGVNCQYRKFKDCRCGYNGIEKTCDRTLTTCKRYGNIERFGGFPSMPSEQVIK